MLVINNAVRTKIDMSHKMKLTFLLSLTSIGLSLACPGPQWPAEFKDSVRDCDKCSEECRTTSRTIVDMNDFCKQLRKLLDGKISDGTEG